MTSTHHTGAGRRPDAIEIEVIGSALSTIVEEMSETMVKAAFSPNIKERRDCTASIFDADGNAIAQDEGGSPLHLGSLMGIVSAIRGRYDASEINAGDVFIGNDPYTGGGSHLPDVVLAEPVFIDGELTAWAATLAHHADFGDRGHAHIFQEAIRIPPLHLYRRGELQNELLQLILLNCQIPEERKADLRAQQASNRLAVTRYTELCGRYGRDTMVAVSEELLDYTEARTRAAIREFPDGEYAFSDVFDCPELDDELTLHVTVTVADDEITFDFSGAPPQVRASVNVVWTGLYAAVYYTLKTLIDPDIAPNAGLNRPVHIEAPLGSLLNCTAPAAVNGRSETAQRVVDIIQGALAPALPHRVTGASNGANTGVHFSGHDPVRDRDFVYLETIGGGSGARWNKDGLDGVQVHMTNTSNLPVEALEIEYPLTVESYELIEGSGGTGEYRGGLGIRRKVRVEAEDIHFWLDTSRQKSQPWGVFGGGPGSSARCVLSEDATPVDHGYTMLQPGQTASIETAGAGGYGDPADRSAGQVDEDVRRGVIDEATAQDYARRRAGK
jgi:N-methylhydantoinase B